MITRRAIALAIGLAAAGSGPASAHTEYQAFVRENSGRAVSCALCHVHSDGPDGTAHGQIGGLSAAEMTRLNRARAAFEPGQPVDSPILNGFGNALVERLGKKRILELRLRPELLAEELGDEDDLDDDGISDAREYLDGTHPLMKSDGAPWLLFKNNFRRFGFHMLMIAVATLATLYGLFCLLRGFAVSAEQSAKEREEGVVG